MTSDSLATWGPIAISGLALVISALAWCAARRSAKAAERSAAADEHAAYQQRKPNLTAEIKPATEGRQWHHLTLRLDGPVSLDELTVEILDRELAYSPNQYGIPQSGQGPHRTAWPHDKNGNRIGLAIGETAGWEVVAVDKHVDSDQVTLRCTARAGNDEWPFLTTVAVPRSLRPGPRATFI